MVIGVSLYAFITGFNAPFEAFRIGQVGQGRSKVIPMFRILPLFVDQFLKETHGFIIALHFQVDSRFN